MGNNLKTAGPLKKISLNLNVGVTLELKDQADAPEALEFIFGIGTEGLTPFECVLDGKQTGDKGFIEVDKKDLNAFFGHIRSCTQTLPVNASHFYLHYNITDISDASPREVVKTMATVGGGGCGGSCDCGCGGSH